MGYIWDSKSLHFPGRLPHDLPPTGSSLPLLLCVVWIMSQKSKAADQARFGPQATLAGSPELVYDLGLGLMT